MRPEKSFAEILKEKLETRYSKGFHADSHEANTAPQGASAAFVTTSAEGWAPFFNIASKSRRFPSGKGPFEREKAKFSAILTDQPPMKTPPPPPEIRILLSDLDSNGSYIYMSWRELGAVQFAGESISEKELKKAFRSLAKKLHPDRGGDNRTFMKLKLEYDFFVEQFEKKKSLEAACHAA